MVKRRVKSYFRKTTRRALSVGASLLEAKIDSRIDDLARFVEVKIDGLDRKLDRINNIAAANRDELLYSTRELYKLRTTSDYERAFDKEPLISVRIATYNRADLLIERAVTSVLKQTYQNFEIVIVGDHCTDDTEEKLKKLNNKKIRFYNLPNRTAYPEDRTKKWMVVGALPMNEAANMARGKWIAPLDDDDKFSADHLEKLLKHAQKTKSELVYGAMTTHDLTTGKTKRYFAFPPEKGEFTFIGAMYMKALDELFKYDFHSWVVDEIADWNLIRRMMESGVRISAFEDSLGDIYLIPATHQKKDY